LFNSKVLAESGFVGREKEFRALQSFLSVAIEGKGKTIFVSGEAGSGKTRLVREFLKLASRMDVAIIEGWCLSEASVPYFPFAKAFDTYFSCQDKEIMSAQEFAQSKNLSGTRPNGIEGFGITTWLTGIRETDESKKSGAISPQVWKDQLFLAIGKTLELISVQKPLILFIDDIHWADSASLALMHFISRTISSERILLLATFRAEELTTDIEGHPHPLAETLRVMRHEDLFTEVKLSSLNHSDVSKIAENMMGGSLQNEFSERLSSDSQGNPLFVIESLKMLHEHKSLVNENNEWHLAINELSIPCKVRDIILRRVSMLKYAERRVLDAASVIGEKFNAELLSAVLGLDVLEVLETLNAVAHSTSIINVDEYYYSFDHSRSRETLYEELSPPLKRGYHLRVAERLEDRSREGKLPLSEIAYHYCQAGFKQKAVKYSLSAGQDALRKWSNSEAIRHFTYVLQNIDDNSGNAADKMIALEGLGDAYGVNCMFDKAKAAYEELADSTTGNLKLRACIKAMEIIWYKEMNPLQLMESIRKIEEQAILDPLESARIIWNRGRAFLFLRDLKRALEDHEEALRLFKEEYSLPDVANLLGGTGATRGSFPIKLDGSNTEFEKAFSEKILGTALTHELNYPQMEATYINIFVAGTLHGVGLFNEALNSYSDALRISEKTGDFNNISFALTYIGELLGLITGNEVNGTRQLEKALEYALKTDSKLTQSRIYASLTTRYAKLGDLKRAEECYGELLKIPNEIVDHYMVFQTVQTAKCIILAARNQNNEANEHFQKTLEAFQTLLPQSLGSEILLRKDYAWALEKQGRTKEADIQKSEANKQSEKVEKIFSNVKIFANFMAKKNATVNEAFEMRLDIVNISKSAGSLVRIIDIVPEEFEITALPEFCIIKGNNIEMKNKSIDPFQVITVKLNLKGKKTGNYTLNPTIDYIDESLKNQDLKLEPIFLEVSPAKPTFEILQDRVTTGYLDLDRLLLGGIPKNHAVIILSPSVDERALIISKFLDVGNELNEITFYITVDAQKAESMAEKSQSNFFAVVCNPLTNIITKNQQNIFKLTGLESLTEIDIALTKLFRKINPDIKVTKRICIEVISDALLQHHALNTRRWLIAILSTLKSKGFTILAMINPQMHLQEENQAITSLFDGEIKITQNEHTKARSLKVTRLTNQRYLEDELILNKSA
jgi:tetratricopeptide (TPR) repeat protein/KaiC/GvpD/RAD55 family RecA-like ATPase